MPAPFYVEFRLKKNEAEVRRIWESLQQQRQKDLRLFRTERGYAGLIRSFFEDGGLCHRFLIGFRALLFTIGIFLLLPTFLLIPLAFLASLATGRERTLPISR